MSQQKQVIRGALFLRFTHGCQICDGDVDLLDHGASVYSLFVHHSSECPFRAKRNEP